MKSGIVKVIILLALSVTALSACSLLGRSIAIVDAKTAVSVGEDLNPINARSVFPKDTATVTCWIKWRDADINTQLLVKWHYATDDIHITDHTFTIPKKNGMGGITLSMPEGKKLPPGNYKVSIVSGNTTLKSLDFSVE